MARCAIDGHRIEPPKGSDYSSIVIVIQSISHPYLPFYDFEVKSGVTDVQKTYGNVRAWELV